MTIAAASATSGALGYAFALGLVGAANPCGIPLLPAYLSLFADPPGVTRRRPLKAMAASAYVTAGFTACFGVLGLAVGAVVASVDKIVPWVMVGLGAALAVAGFAGVAGRRPWSSVPRLRVRVNRRHPGAMFGFGVVYGLASLGCALPVYLAAVGGTLEHPGVLALFWASVAYALGMGLLLAVLALTASTARLAVVRAVRPAGRAGQVVASLLLAVSGSYLAYYWATNLADPSSVPPLVGRVEAVQSTVSAWMAANYRWLGLAFGLTVLAVLVAASVGGAGGRPAEAEESPAAASSAGSTRALAGRRG